jgi:hypothetical protein
VKNFYPGCQRFIKVKSNNCRITGNIQQVRSNSKSLTKAQMGCKQQPKNENLLAQPNKKLLRGDVRKAQSAGRKAQSAGRKANNTINAMRKAPCAMRAPPGRRRQIQVQERRLKGKNWGRLEFVSLVLGFTIGTGV